MRGVVLDVTTPQVAELVASEMLLRIPGMRPDARIDGVTVQPMIVRRNGVELVAGIADDPVFGPVVVFGRGGLAVEVIADKALALPPLDMHLAHDLIAQTRVSRVLKGYRNRPAADSEAVALTLVKLAQLSADIPEIRSLDLNPLVADDSGVLSLDARISVAPVEARVGGWSNPRFAIRPYPKQWERVMELRDGSRAIVRPIRPEDEVLYPAFFERVTPEDLRLRFFAPVRDFSHKFIARLTQIDYSRDMAFLAADEESGELLGVVRLSSEPDRESGEYAILLRSDLKGKGLGWRLMRLLIEYARSEGFSSIHGQVLRENTTMLSMCEGLGFRIRTDPDEPNIAQVTLPLDEDIDEEKGVAPELRKSA
ncbi:MAG: GNAT family N-acetyltransferase [Hyphomicrobiales bacterium]